MKRFPPLLVRRYTQSSDWLKASETAGREKKMPKSVGASTQPCFTQLLIGYEVEPSNWKIPCMSSWKDVIILRSLGASNLLQESAD